MNFREEAEKYEQWIIEQRRFFHQCPELSQEEFNTTKEIGKRLEEMGLEPHYYEGYPGLTADIKGGKAGAGTKTVALRADIDALPVEEHTGLEFCSRNNGVMHACGHDCHISMLLGGVKMLLDHRDELKGSVRILFQPAEEVAMGAKYMIQHGALDGVDAVYGAHIWGGFEAPYLNFETGPRMASCDKFTVEIEGLSAHGSAPHAGVDALTTAMHIVSEAQEIVSRYNDPLNPLVVTFGTINGGQRWNIIPNRVVMEGTVRTLSAEMRKRAEELLRSIVEHVTAIHGAKGTVTVEYLTSPVINNHEDLNKIAENAAVKMYGEGCLKHLDSMMGSEDFAFFMDEVPGIYGFLGSYDPKLGYTASNHNDCYTVDESLLKRGAAMYAQFAADYLEAKAE
ncbi:MAG TPA: amidohydrolase [Candidatus Lachnoclostridium stercorigallinarum]|uniref:Amidohydrolase n=1 Tax=Candidatus Lachnoclostridium stercorigallinarum TaxID=2838634 RepID=A0A9D2GHX9_9FIRM|nr:amidohydrolase [Candidatus Lachnoclostridium stercorigallinarum]